MKYCAFMVSRQCQIQLFFFENLSWASEFQDTTTKHAFVCILIFSNFLKPDFIGPAKYSRRYYNHNFSQVSEQDTILKFLYHMTMSLFFNKFSG